MIPDNPFPNASALSKNTLEAGVYVLARSDDADALMDTMLNLPYVAVRIEPDGTVMVGEAHCRSVTCAIAYILARWW